MDSRLVPKASVEVTDKGKSRMLFGNAEDEREADVEKEDIAAALLAAQPSSGDVFDVISKLEHFALAVKFGYLVEDKRLADIDLVIQIVTDLEERRKHLHDFLELESIKTSQLRSNFNEVKDDGEKEISESVVAARQLNLGRMRNLEGEVHSLDERIEFLKNDMTRLEADNKKLEQVRNESQTEYDEIVQELNKQMMRKADNQITLNEIRDQIKDAGEKIVEMEEDLIIQKEELIHEREEAKIEKQQLVIDIEGEDKTLKSQQVVNTEKRTDLNIVLDDLKKTKTELKSAKKIWEGLSHELNILTQQEVELHGKISREHDSIASIRKQLEDIYEARNAAQAIFNDREAELDQQMKTLGDKCEYEDGRISEFQVKRKNIEDTERSLKPKVKELVEREAAITQALKQKKEELREVAERRADFDRRMQIANEQIISNTSIHKATMEQLGRDFEQTKRLLMENREERDVAREKCDELAAEITAAREEQQKYLDEANAITRQQEENLERLAQERERLHKSIKSCDNQIANFNQTITTETEDMEKMTKDKTAYLADLQRQVDELTNEVNHNDEMLAVERPAYEQLKIDHANRTVECEQLKREVVVKKAKVAELETKLKIANDYIKHFPRLHESLEADVSKSNRDFDANRQKWHTEIMEIERHIVATWIKLKQVILENDHFHKAVNIMEVRIHDADALISANERQQRTIDGVISKEKTHMDELFSKFKKDQESIRSRDQVDLDRYLVISELTGDRLECVTAVLNGLDGNLRTMQNFLEVLSGLREEEPEKPLLPEDDEPLLRIEHMN